MHLCLYVCQRRSCRAFLPSQDRLKNVSLGTSKINYNDPRITVTPSLSLSLKPSPNPNPDPNPNPNPDPNPSPDPDH